MKVKLQQFVMIALTLALLAGGLPVSAQSDDTTLQQLDEARKQAAMYLSQQGELQRDAEVSEEGVKDLAAELAKQQAVVAASKARVDEVTAKIVRLKKDRATFIEAAYLSGHDDNLLYVLVESSSISEFLTRGRYTAFMLDEKEAILRDVDSSLKALDKERRDLVTKQNTVESQIASLQHRIAEIQRKLAANQANLDAARSLEAMLAGLTGNHNRNDRPWLKNNTPVGDRYTFVGGGTEHGLGMSQYGAKGAAQRGKNYRDILSHYYRGAQLTTLGENPQVNVGGDLETYLVGVVEAEMNSNWPMDALKAQAVAARSYAYMNRTRLDNTPRTQAWVGPHLQTENARRAVAETRGQVLSFGGEVIAAYFHSTSGGHTENNENVWGGTPLAWLRGVESPWETDSPHWEWRTASYSREEMQMILSRDDRTNVGTLQTIRIKGRGVGGRVTSIEIVGSAGTKTVSGPRFKTLFNTHTPAGENGLRSTLFAFI